MKKYIVILCFIFIGCKNETNKLQTNQNQLMNKNIIEDANILNIDIDSSSIFWLGKKMVKIYLPLRNTRKKASHKKSFSRKF